MREIGSHDHQKRLIGYTGALLGWCAPVFTADAKMRTTEDETLATITVRAQRIANEEPAGLYATIATAWRYDPHVDLESRDRPEAQVDVTVRGGVYENTAGVMSRQPPPREGQGRLEAGRHFATTRRLLIFR